MRRESNKIRFEHSPLPLPLPLPLPFSLSLSLAQSTKTLLQILSVPVAQLDKASVNVLKIVGSIPTEGTTFLSSFFIFDDHA